MLDLSSFGLGTVAPVAYLLFGAALYGAFSAGKWLAASLFHLPRLTIYMRGKQQA